MNGSTTMTRHYQPWTEQENAYLEEAYKSPFTTLEEMTEHLNRSVHSITARAFVKGYRRPPMRFREIMNNKKLIEQIDEIEEKQGLPKGYIAELLYQKARKGEEIGKTISELIAESYVTFEDVVNGLANITVDQPSETDIKIATEELHKAVDNIINPSDKAKKAMEEMGVK